MVSSIDNLPRFIVILNLRQTEARLFVHSFNNILSV